MFVFINNVIVYLYVLRNDYPILFYKSIQVTFYKSHVL
jgi:hypothetical protein